MRKGSFTLYPQQAHNVRKKKTHTQTPVHQQKSHSIKLLYPQESDSINEAYLWNQQSGKSYQGGARQWDEGRREKEEVGGEWRRECDELK